MNYYNLDMIVAIGFRVRSNIGTNFRKWANERLTAFSGDYPTLLDATIAKKYLTNKELNI